MGPDELIRAIREIAAGIADSVPEVCARLRRIAGSIAQEQVTINFGGVFKAGKSTMMNGVVGRDILPVDDVPETGAICCLLAGDRDAAAIVESGRRRSIPCTTDAIRAEITLLSVQGDRRTEVAAIERAEIVLKDCIIPPNACWVDSPGYNDTAEMDERTRRSAAYADVLVWVLTSRQLLSQVEMEFLTNHIREAGAASVLFVLNGFLRRDTPEEWEQFLSKSAPQLINKVNHFAADMGFTDQAPAAILPVAGRAMCKGGQRSFGGDALLRFMTDVNSAQHPRVQRTRLWRASAALRQCVEALDEPVAERARAVEKLRQEAEEVNRIAESRTRLKDGLGKSVDQFLEEFASGARSNGDALAARITDLAGLAGGVGATQWNQAMTSMAETAGRAMVARMQGVLRAQGQAPLNRDWEEYFASVCRPPQAMFHFPVRLEAGGLDAYIQGVPALLGERFGHAPQWLGEVRAEIQRVTNAVIQAMRSRRPQFMGGLESLYKLEAHTLPPVDDSPVKRLQQAQDRLRELAAEAASLAMHSKAEAAPRGWNQGMV
jgi:predicted GTPase